MERRYLLVLLLVCLCAEPVVSRRPYKAADEARGLEERLSRIGRNTKKLGEAVLDKPNAHDHRKHHRHKQHLLEEEGANDDLIAASAKDDKGLDDGKYEDSPEDEEKEKAANKKKMYIFLALCLVVIIISGVIAYYINKSKVEHTNNLNNETESVSMAGFMGFDGMPKPINVFVGMASGLVFGFIDNAGLFFGMEYLDPFFSTLKYGDEEQVVAGYGNTFSDGIGAFLGTFAGSIVKDLAVKHGGYIEAEDYPIWSEAVGIIIGCIFGVAIPRMILGDPKVTRMNRARAEALANGVTQAQIDEVMTEFDKLDKKYSPERPGEVKVSQLKDATPGSIDKFISEADAAGNNDGWVSRDELLILLTKANKKYKKASTEIINKADKSTTDEGVAKPAKK